MATNRNVTRTPQDIKLQACLTDADAVSEYRFLVDGKDIKYITVDPGVFPADDISFEPALKARLPIFPPGNWNEGHITKDATTGDAVFATILRRNLPGVQNVWHKIKIDHLQLTWTGRLRQNVRIVTCPEFDHSAVYKFAEFPWQIPNIESETAAYGWIDGHDIGPRFLGHVTEAGRVIGFLIEKVAGHTATVADLDACQHVLRELHLLRLKHGDVNKHNFLIKEGGEAVLIDFEATGRCEDEQECSTELETVLKQLEADDGRGGVIEEG
ncbi:alpha-galactosidase a precursor [Grosmannia clavigera kw1407]|uniref:Alpha-galactosidase a n=1 Tax=Grosmannia clavigera (strain kw1407 / UAMH 11150) TaxID=655863 RepID=F0XHY3_GROCL|nr:alpha-galactosidase a precursor [Grosmannia clavigera kw1407]EFX02794.1 alpha-galactosidase a precursor [Grosmannia clavigera kw1407]